MGNRFFQPQGVRADLRRHDTFGLQVPRERDCFVLADVLYVETLAVQVTTLDDIVIEERDPSDAFPHQRGRDLRVDPARSDAQHAGFRVQSLIESNKSFLPIVGSGNCCAANLNRGS